MATPNLRMDEKIRNREAIDVTHCRKEGDYYILESFDDGQDVDYCDTVADRWIWSIGRRISDGVILASTKADLYQNPEFECLWLR